MLHQRTLRTVRRRIPPTTSRWGRPCLTTSAESVCGRGPSTILRLDLHRHPSDQRRRLLSSSSSSKRQRRRIQEEEFQDIPRWPAVASILMVPLMIGAWQVSEYFLGNRQVGLNERLRQEFQQEYSLDELQTMPALFCCVVRKTGGFTHCLSGSVRIGDVVEVLQEGVGPKQEYNLCRLPADHRDDSGVAVDIYGWFPYRWLEKLEHYEAMVQKQQAENNNREN